MPFQTTGMLCLLKKDTKLNAEKQLKNAKEFLVVWTTFLQLLG